ncbi:hypothetical protein [Rhodococcus artemisiae]|uniref:hypothetical protein n=1 Tax=Rhodococcus artemisiae TaxID=714159 RepID=UPI0038B49DE9
MSNPPDPRRGCGTGPPRGRAALDRRAADEAREPEACGFRLAGDFAVDAFAVDVRGAGFFAVDPFAERAEDALADEVDLAAGAPARPEAADARVPDRDREVAVDDARLPDFPAISARVAASTTHEPSATRGARGGTDHNTEP